jgi:hypothetical protein
MAGPVFMQCQDLIGPKAGGIAGFMAVNGKIGAVKFIQAIVGSKPHQSVAVL